MANSFGHFTLWVSVSDVLKSEPSCISHKPRASFQRWQVHRGLVHEICPHTETQSYKIICTNKQYILPSVDSSSSESSVSTSKCFSGDFFPVLTRYFCPPSACLQTIDTRTIKMQQNFFFENMVLSGGTRAECERTM